MIESKANKNDLVLFAYPEPFAPYRWYDHQGVVALGATDSISPNDEDTKIRVEKYVNGRNSVYTFEYLNKISDPNKQVEKSLDGLGFYIIDLYNFNGVGIIREWRKKWTIKFIYGC